MAELLQLVLLLILGALGLSVLAVARLSGVRPGRGRHAAAVEAGPAAEALDWRGPLAEAYPQPGSELS